MSISASISPCSAVGRSAPDCLVDGHMCSYVLGGDVEGFIGILSGDDAVKRRLAQGGLRSGSRDCIVLVVLVWILETVIEELLDESLIEDLLLTIYDEELEPELELLITDCVSWLGF